MTSQMTHIFPISQALCLYIYTLEQPVISTLTKEAQLFWENNHGRRRIKYLKKVVGQAFCSSLMQLVLTF